MNDQIQHVCYKHARKVCEYLSIPPDSAAFVRVHLSLIALAIEVIELATDQPRKCKKCGITTLLPDGFCPQCVDEPTAAEVREKICEVKQPGVPSQP